MRFLQGLETKRANPLDATARAVGNGYGGLATTSLVNNYQANWHLDKAVKRGYEVLIDVFRCVDAISQNAAALEQFVQRGLRGRGKRINDDQLEYVLNTRSNPYETAFQFRYRLSGQLLLSTKGAFVEIVPNKDNRPAQLQLLHPSNVEVLPDPKKFVSGYKVTQANGQIDELDPDQVIWLRLKPHPTDPFAQMTPMQAAGLTVESEFLARIFNRAVVANNGKPSQLITIGELLNQEDAKEIKYKLGGRGPATAGNTTVIEATGVDVHDLMATPADLQYLSGLASSKEEIYTAFGTPESVLGNASGRTYDNADAERLNWWMDTMVPHCDGIAACWDGLTAGGREDDLFVVNNYESVDVLQRAKQQKADKLLAEVQSGVRTVDSYLIETGQVPFNVPATQVLYVNAVGKLPIGRDDATTQAAIQLSEQAQGLLAPGVQQGMTPDQMQASARQGAIDGWQQGQRQLANDTAARALAVVGKALQAALEMKTDRSPRELHVAEKSSLSEDDDNHPVVLTVDDKSHPYEMLRATVEGEMVGFLSSWSNRQTQDALARLDGAKARKGTRHWEGDGYGTKSLDTGYLIDPDKWANDLADNMRESFLRVVEQQLKRTARELDQHGLVDRVVREGKGNPYARHPANRLFGSGATGIDRVRNSVVDEVTAMVRTAAFNQSRRLQEKIARLDSEGAGIAEIKQAVREMTGKRSSWYKGLSINATTALVEGTITKTAEPVQEYIERTWHCQHDEKTRVTHRQADGQKVNGIESFTVGGHPIPYPGAPSAPIEEKANCRCWQEIQVK